MTNMGSVGQMPTCQHCGSKWTWKHTVKNQWCDESWDELQLLWKKAIPHGQIKNENGCMYHAPTIHSTLTVIV